MVYFDGVSSNRLRRIIARISVRHRILGCPGWRHHHRHVGVPSLTSISWLLHRESSISVRVEVHVCKATSKLINQLPGSLVPHIANPSNNGVWGLGFGVWGLGFGRSEEHTSELQSQSNLV